jgi:hypothetical protein
MKPASHIIIVSSMAAINGSPLSGSYAGAKRMLWFMADYRFRTRKIGAPDKLAQGIQTYRLALVTNNPAKLTVRNFTQCISSRVDWHRVYPMADAESNSLTEIWTRDENNWTIGYCITAVRGL